jgi:hypothetical protein
MLEEKTIEYLKKGNNIEDLCILKLMPPLFNLMEKYGLKTILNCQEDFKNLRFVFKSPKIRLYHVEVWHFGAEPFPPYRIKILACFKTENNTMTDYFRLQTDITNGIDFLTIEKIIKSIEREISESNLCL